MSEKTYAERTHRDTLEIAFASSEARHREMLWVLDRIATAMEDGNAAFTQTADRL